MEVPFSRSTLDEEEVRAASEAIASGHISGDGPTCRAAEVWLREWLSCPHLLLTTSCTHAMEMALLALEIEEGAEIILPSFSFVSGANAVLRAGGVPVFADVEPTFLNLSSQAVTEAVTPRTAGILCVHYAGVPCHMDHLLEVSEQHGLFLVEDAAQALGARWTDGRFLGTLGNAGCYSFHGTKNVVCGEGGALATRNGNLAKRAEVIREKGTDRSAFLRGEVDRYTWQEEGSSYVLSDLLASVLQVQLGKLEAFQEERRRLGMRYVEGLRPLAEEELILLPPFDVVADFINWHIFHIRIIGGGGKRDLVIRALRERGIETTFHFVPLHSSPYAKHFLQTEDLYLPVTEEAADSLLRLPLYPGLQEDEQQYVIDCLASVLREEAKA